MLRTPLLTTAFALAFAAAAPAQTPAGAAEAQKLEQSGRALIQAANDWRIANGVPAVTWSEAIAVVLREQLSKAIAAGYEGGPAPREVGRAPMLARKFHGMQIKMFDNYSTTTPDEFDPAKIIAEQVAHPQIKQYPNAGLGLGAAAVAKSAEGKWICLIALAEGKGDQLVRVQREIDPHWKAVAGADAEARDAAITALAEKKHIEGLAALLVGLRHADAGARAKSAAALGKIKNRGIIPPLLMALTDAKPEVKQAALDALIALTGREDIGLDAAKWTLWWSKAIDNFVVPTDGTEAKDATPLDDGGTAGETIEQLLNGWNEAVKRKDLLRKIQILEALRDKEGAEKDRKVQALMKKALGDTDHKVIAEAVRGCARLKIKSAVPVMMKLVKTYEKKSEDTAKIALLGLAQIGDLKALPTFTDAGWNAGWQVLASRVFAIRYMRSGASVDWLLSLFNLGRGRGRRGGGMGGNRVTRPIFESLEFLTGESLGRDVDAWKDWWKKAKGRFRPEPLPDDYEVEGLFPRKKPTKEERERNKKNQKKNNKNE